MAKAVVNNSLFHTHVEILCNFIELYTSHLPRLSDGTILRISSAVRNCGGNDNFIQDMNIVKNLIEASLVVAPSEENEQMTPAESYVYMHMSKIITKSAKTNAVLVQASQDMLKYVGSFSSDIIIDAEELVFIMSAISVPEKFVDVIRTSGRKSMKKKDVKTTHTLVRLQSDFEDAVAAAIKIDETTLRLLASKLSPYLAAIGLLFDSCLLLVSLYKHLIHVTQKRWSPSSIAISDKNIITTKSIFPYFLADDAVTNDIEMSRTTCVITGSNAHGKSTFLRSLIVNALLANTGLYVSAGNVSSIHFDSLHLRLPENDKPSQGLSSFQSEVLDIADILPKLTQDSLVVFDEIGRATCHRECVAFNVALIKYLNKLGCCSILASHCHDVLDIFSSTEIRRMICTNYHVMDGECRSSDSLNVLKQLNMPMSFISDAEEFLGITATETVVPSSPCLSSPPSSPTSTSPPSSPLSFATNFEYAASVAKDTFVDSKWIMVEAGCLAPPTIQLWKATLYVIDEGKYLYVGESKNVNVRQQQHVSKNNRTGRMIIFSCNDKSESLRYETLLQKKYITLGVPLSSTMDSQHH